MNDLETMGVAQIWLVDRPDGVWQRLNDGRLAVCEDFHLADRNIHFPMGEITKLVR